MVNIDVTAQQTTFQEAQIYDLAFENSLLLAITFLLIVKFQVFDTWSLLLGTWLTIVTARKHQALPRHNVLHLQHKIQLYRQSISNMHQNMTTKTKEINADSVFAQNLKEL